MHQLHDKRQYSVNGRTSLTPESAGERRQGELGSLVESELTQVFLRLRRTRSRVGFSWAVYTASVVNDT